MTPPQQGVAELDLSSENSLPKSSESGWSTTERLIQLDRTEGTQTSTQWNKEPEFSPINGGSQGRDRMKVIEIEQAACKKVLALLDSYISNELTIETTAEVLKHLERCPQCLRVARTRQQVKVRLKEALALEGARPEFKKQVSLMLRRAARSLS